MFMMVIMSSLSFWIPLSNARGGSGERITFASTSLLTIVAIVLFTADRRPMLDETTWLDHWQNACILFTLVPIIETVVIFWLNGIFETVQDSVLARQEREAERDMVHAEAAVANPPLPSTAPLAASPGSRTTSQDAAPSEGACSPGSATSAAGVSGGVSGRNLTASSEAQADAASLEAEPVRSPTGASASRQAQEEEIGQKLKAVGRQRESDIISVVYYFLAFFGDAMSIDIVFRHCHPLFSQAYLMSLYLEIEGEFTQDFFYAGGILSWPLHFMGFCLTALAIYFLLRCLARMLSSRRSSESLDSRIVRMQSLKLESSLANKKSSVGSTGMGGFFRPLRFSSTSGKGSLSDTSAPGGTASGAADFRWQVELDENQWYDFYPDQQKMLSDTLVSSTRFAWTVYI
eukprot:TRINITY_DN5220_c1_g1_i4.p1 TRINITY_DN5220_c1_g1~~TRINITY_DN5220_c1_g1_i4.p1  ORF type:complete len:404 (-),score=69.55 TRINITY_DN5220_c1_g1_i4:130-1341(-)